MWYRYGYIINITLEHNHLRFNRIYLGGHTARRASAFSLLLLFPFILVASTDPQPVSSFSLCKLRHAWRKTDTFCRCDVQLATSVIGFRCNQIYQRHDFTVPYSQWWPSKRSTTNVNDASSLTNVARYFLRWRTRFLSGRTIALQFRPL